MIKVAIHQPDFLPWLGFFTKMKKSDVFIILDHTENNPRDAAFWGRRVKIAINNREQWLSIPLEKVSGRIGVPIKEMTINLRNKDFIDQHLKTIRHNYSKTPYYADVYPVLEQYFLMEDCSLLNRNMFFINWVRDKLDIKTKIVYSSELDPKEKSTALLIELIKKVNGTIYISGDGARDYMNISKFEDHNIKIQYNDFHHPVYSQYNTTHFIKGLSIFDTYMNLGNDKLSQLLQLLATNKIEIN